METTTPLVEGFLLGISLIAAIGAQNLFVLRQGIIGEHIFLTATTCCVCDFLLVCIGAMGAGSVITEFFWLKTLAVVGGALFLLYYAYNSFRNILKGRSYELLVCSQGVTIERRTLLLSALGFSLLNPHAILDTVVLIGGLSGQFTELADRTSFALGVGLSSIVWFYSIAYGARFFAPLLRRKNAAIALDLFTGSIMTWIAYTLICTHIVTYAAALA